MRLHDVVGIWYVQVMCLPSTIKSSGATPLVKHAENFYDEKHKNCSVAKDGKRHCIPGCPGTHLKSFTASGFNADTSHVVGQFRPSTYLGNGNHALSVAVVVP